MKFDEQNKVIIDSMDAKEARVFVKFLLSEIERHKVDIQQAENLILEVMRKFHL